jgi:hypothetical protein
VKGVNLRNIDFHGATHTEAAHCDAVPRYYFHLRDDMSVDDEEGQELADLDAARRTAAKYALDMSAASILEHAKINLNHRIEVADGGGEIVLTVEFGDVVTVED